MLVRRDKFLATLAALGLLAAIACLASASASGAPGKKKCSSFASQKAAQKFFVRNGGSESDNVDGLDPDGDGLVCPNNPGPFSAYVEIGFAKGFFYGHVVCVSYPGHWTKREEKAAEKKAKEDEPTPCDSTLITVELMEAAPGPDRLVASHKAIAAEDPTTLPAGASEKNVKGEILSFEWKLTPKKANGTFYALSKECFGTHSRRVNTAG